MRLSRTAFTLVELLVVIAIIAIMSMMLLPAVNAARESARRNQCQARVTQQILAIHEFEMANSALPKGTIDSNRPVVNREVGMHHSWIIQILPFVDEGVVFAAIDQTKSVYDAANANARNTSIVVVRCPSSAVTGAISDYAGVHHDVESPIDETNDGVFILNRALTSDDISDGMAHTLFVGEKLSDAAGEFGWMSGTRSTLRNTGMGVNEKLSGVNPDFYGTGISAAPIGDGVKVGLSQEPAGRVDAASTGQPATRMVALDAATLAAITNGTYVGGFGSEHLSGAVFAFGDGTVQFVSDSIDRRTFQQLGNRHDGQLLQSDEY